MRLLAAALASAGIALVLHGGGDRAPVEAAPRDPPPESVPEALSGWLAMEGERRLKAGDLIAARRAADLAAAMSPTEAALDLIAATRGGDPGRDASHGERKREDLVRRARRHLADGNAVQAMMTLEEARSLDPEDARVISLIREVESALKAEGSGAPAGPQFPEAEMEARAEEARRAKEGAMPAIEGAMEAARASRGMEAAAAIEALRSARDGLAAAAALLPGDSDIAAAIEEIDRAESFAAERVVARARAVQRFRGCAAALPIYRDIIRLLGRKGPAGQEAEWEIASCSGDSTRGR